MSVSNNSKYLYSTKIARTLAAVKLKLTCQQQKKGRKKPLEVIKQAKIFSGTHCRQIRYEE
jgi:hypothetical protein